MFRIGIDVGGTFTDLVAVDDDGNIINIKGPSVPRKPEIGVIEVFKLFLKANEPSSISIVSHATTIATNALFGQLELELPRAALITTKGFRDVIEIGRQRRPELYNIFFKKPKPIIPRRYRYEIDERIGSKGEEIKPVDEIEVESVAEEIKAENIKAVAVGLLNSHLNPSHEVYVKKIISCVHPEAFIVASSEISPEYREYERISTTVVNAVLMPIIKTYVKNLIDGLKRMRVEAPLFIMQSNGGLTPAENAYSRPAAMIESGPASGVIASAFYGDLLGERRIMSFDMGGTTAKAGTVIDGKPEIVMEYEVGGTVHKGRIVKGSGYPVRFPFIDLAECSAGGGTIAWIDEAGALRVGPVSAGADPGPACYGMGGTDPTITDANLLLGRLPKTLLGGRMKLYLELAEKAVMDRVAKPLGMSLADASYSIIRIANSMMAKILRIVSVERGYDPREFVLVAFGGAGPMHACALAEDLGISKIVIPTIPGLFSSLGLLVSDVKHNFVRAVMVDLSRVETEDIELLFKEMEDEGMKTLLREGFNEERIALIRYVDARYREQSYEITIPVGRPFTYEIESLARKFHERHRSLYGYMAEEESIEIVNIRLTAIGLMKKLKLKRLRSGDSSPSAESLLGFRDVYFEKENDYVKCPIYSRTKLRPNNEVEGPLIIEQYDSTVVVYPDWRITVDDYGNIIIVKR